MTMSKISLVVMMAVIVRINRLYTEFAFFHVKAYYLKCGTFVGFLNRTGVTLVGKPYSHTFVLGSEPYTSHKFLTNQILIIRLVLPEKD